MTLSFENSYLLYGRQEYAEASPEKRRHLDRLREQCILANGGALPPRTWAGPQHDPEWPDFERGYLAGKHQLRVAVAFAMLRTVFPVPHRETTQQALQEAVAALETSAPDAPELEALKQFMQSNRSTNEGGSK